MSIIHEDLDDIQKWALTLERVAKDLREWEDLPSLFEISAELSICSNAIEKTIHANAMVRMLQSMNIKS